MMKMPVLIAGVAVVISGCASAPAVEPIPTPIEPSAAVKAECALYEAAMMRAAAGGTPDETIMEFCPGYEHVMTFDQFKGAGLFLGAAGTKIPEEAKAMGRGGKNLFQKMLARGVPKDVATAMISDPRFAAAVAYY